MGGNVHIENIFGGKLSGYPQSRLTMIFYIGSLFYLQFFFHLHNYIFQLLNIFNTYLIFIILRGNIH